MILTHYFSRIALNPTITIRAVEILHAPVNNGACLFVNLIKMPMLTQSIRALWRITVILLAVTPLLFAISTPTLTQEATEDADEGSTLTIPRPVPSATFERDGVQLDLLFENLPQGRVGLLHIPTEGVTGARVRFRDQLADFFPVEGDGLYGMVAVNMDLPARVYEFDVLAFMENGDRITIPAQMNVVLGGFIRQDFELESDRAFLADPQIERVEFARLDSVQDEVTLERPWADDGFQVPIDSEITSPFGAFRVINQNTETRHTGWDLRAPVGTPIMAMGAGTVAFAGLMDIRGNHVIIDHGYGIYSGYSHLSQVHVTRGQPITRGQILGMTGNTGRSNGPHLHWEVAVNEEWVDSVDFLLTWLP